MQGTRCRRPHPFVCHNSQTFDPSCHLPACDGTVLSLHGPRTYAPAGTAAASMLLPAKIGRAGTYRYDGMLDVLEKTVRREGFLGLYKGVLPNLFKLAPAAGISWFTFEVTRVPQAWPRSVASERQLGICDWLLDVFVRRL